MTTNKVAVYGTLREGQGNWNWALRNRSEKMGEAEISGFQMYSTGGFPAVVHATDEDVIKIEVYEVDDEVFADLDRLEGYPTMYTREQVDTEYGPAWLYIWNSSTARLQLLPEGDWVAYRQAS